MDYLISRLQKDHSSSRSENLHPTSLDNETTVVELFQSQGCSSCPPTNDNVLNLTSDPNILVLTYDVTYWDYLGWKDTFGNSAFDRRQRAYAQTFQRKNVYTPQVIVNGLIDGVGNSAKDLRFLLQKGQPSGGQHSVAMHHQPSQDGRDIVLSIQGTSNSTGTVNLVRYNPSMFDVPIARGENGGRTLAHRNVVRDITRLGSWDGGDREFRFPSGWIQGDLRAAVLVQEGEAGPILGAIKV